MGGPSRGRVPVLTESELEPPASVFQTNNQEREREDYNGNDESDRDVTNES
jgi:hypothetical protein